VEVVASGAETRVDVGLARGAGPSGTVRLRGGRTAAGARLVLVGARGTASLTGTGELHSGSGDVARAESDAEGGFELRPVLAPLLLAAAHPRGFALVPLSRGPAPSELVLDPWGRVEGDVRRGGRWAGHEILTLEAAEERAALAITLQTESDASGRFTFEHVPAGAYRIAFRRRLENAGVSRPTQVRVVRAEAGRTVRVELGGRGRLLVGKIEFVGRRQPIAWNTFHHRLEALESPSGVIELAVEFSPFGSYRIEDVPEGRYRLRLQIPGFAQPVVRDVDVPPGPAAVPVNLGTMTFR
jgi:hypothetical protein